MSPVTYALTLHRPWPAAITHLGKDVENRDWRPRLAPGRIALHAGRTLDQVAVARLEDEHGLLPEAAMATGLIATASVTEIHAAEVCRGRGSCSEWAARTGFHWRLDDVKALEAPIPARGRQRLWRLSPEQREAVRRQELGLTAR